MSGNHHTLLAMNCHNDKAKEQFWLYALIIQFWLYNFEWTDNTWETLLYGNRSCHNALHCLWLLALLSTYILHTLKRSAKGWAHQQSIDITCQKSISFLRNKKTGFLFTNMLIFFVSLRDKYAQDCFGI